MKCWGHLPACRAAISRDELWQPTARLKVKSSQVDEFAESAGRYEKSEDVCSADFAESPENFDARFWGGIPVPAGLVRPLNGAAACRWFRG